MEFPGEIQLPRSDFGAFRLVEPGGQQFEIGNHVVEFGADGAGNDMVHREFLASVGTALDGGRFPTLHLRHAVRVEAAKLRGDVEISEKFRLGQLGGFGLVAGGGNGGVENRRYLKTLIPGWLKELELVRTEHGLDCAEALCSFTRLHYAEMVALADKANFRHALWRIGEAVASVFADVVQLQPTLQDLPSNGPEWDELTRRWRRG